MNLGGIFKDLGNLEKARFYTLKSIDLKPGNVKAITNLLGIYAEEDLAILKEIIWKGIACNANLLNNLSYLDAISSLGMDLINGVLIDNTCYGDPQTLGVDSKDYNSYINNAVLLLEQGNTDQAIELIERAACINPSEQCSILLASAYQNSGQLKKAITEYKRIDLKKSQNKMTSFNLGLCLLNIGDNNGAIEAFKIAIDIDSSFIAAWGNIGTAFKKGKNSRSHSRNSKSS